MKNTILGFLACYTILITCYAAGLHTGKVASIQQACVEHTDELTHALQRGMR